ncbi:MAG: hypothetical protein IT379_14910 [Deltaproteobacteria bacterium]|nr:hypothetical protein [Deltaproteobacteria bacterium]
MFKGTITKGSQYRIDVTAASANRGATIVTIQWPGARGQSDVLIVAQGGAAAKSGKVPAGAALLMIVVDIPTGSASASIHVADNRGTSVRDVVRKDQRWTFAVQ